MFLLKFICVNFNNTDYSRKLVQSLELQTGRKELFSAECVIVDNSTNEQDAADCEDLSRAYPWVTYMRAPKNLGYFGGLNYGISACGRADAEYTVICNNDLQFRDDFCEKLLGTEYDSTIFAVCPDVITADGLHQNPHILRRISALRRFQFDLYFSHFYVSRLLIAVLRVVRPVKSSPSQPKEGCEMHMGVGACYVLTPEFFKHFKTLNYPFFLFGEEAYISEQIHSADGILWFDPNLRVDHAESAALSKVLNRKAYEFSREGYPNYRKLL